MALKSREGFGTLTCPSAMWVHEYLGLANAECSLYSPHEMFRESSVANCRLGPHLASSEVSCCVSEETGDEIRFEHRLFGFESVRCTIRKNQVSR